jgi:hypothetical protein
LVGILFVELSGRPASLDLAGKSTFLALAHQRRCRIPFNVWFTNAGGGRVGEAALADLNAAVGLDPKFAKN